MAEQFKVGDIVVVTKSHSGNYSRPGQIVRIIEKDNTSSPYRPYRVEDFNKLYNWMGEKSWCKEVRKPTFDELCSINETYIFSYDIY